MTDILAGQVYPFDPTGTLASNKITGEQQTITAVNWMDYHFIVPSFAPFFADTLVVQFKDTNGVTKTLVEGQDYLIAYEFISASRSCAKRIWGGISFIDTNLAGVVSLTYQTVGGTWTLNSQAIAQILQDKIDNPRTTAWEEVVDMPVMFPVIDHEWDLVDMVGASEIVTALNGIEEQLRQQSASGLAAHLADFNNPHQTTAAQVGLGNVSNFGTATNADGIAGTSSTLFMTPAATNAAISQGASQALQNHINDHNNPHVTTAAQVGAYSTQQTDNLLSQKLGLTDVAYDTAHAYGLLYPDLAAEILTGTAANSNQLSGLTLSQLSAQILSGQAADAAHFNGQTPAQFAASVLTGTAANSTLFGGYDINSYKTFALNGTAANANTVGGKTASQIEQDILASISGGTASVLADLHPQTETDANGNYWSELGQLPVWQTGTPLSDNQDIHWFISGADSGGEVQSAMWYLHLSARGGSSAPVAATLTNFSSNTPQATIGYTIENLNSVQTVRIWIKTAQNRGTITIAEMAKGNSSTIDTNDGLTTEPVNIVYLSTGSGGLATKADVNAVQTELTSAIQSMTASFNALTATLSS